MGSFGISEGNTNGGKNINKLNPQIMGLTTAPSREVAQMLVSATSEQGLGKEAQAASSGLRVRTRPECPEDSLKELT